MDKQQDDDDSNGSENSSSTEGTDSFGIHLSQENDDEEANFAEPFANEDPNEPTMTPSEFIERMKEEVDILEGLVLSRNFCPSYLDMQACLQGLRKTTSLVRAKIAEASNHNSSHERALAMTKSSKRQKVSQFGTTSYI